MGRMYCVQTNGITLDEDRDLFEVLASTGKPIRIHGWHLEQITDVGDAAEEIIRVETVRGVGAVTSGSGGSTPTAHPIDDPDISGPTVEANNTTRMVVGSGTLETLEQFAWNIRVPWTHFYTPETRPRVVPGDRWTLAALAAAMADAVTFGSTLWFEEV